MSSYRCPLCGYENGSVYGIQRHAAHMHAGLSICPVCGERHARLLNHLRQGDDEHQMWYYLLRTRKAGFVRVDTDAHRALVRGEKLAEERLVVP